VDRPALSLLERLRRAPTWVRRPRRPAGPPRAPRPGLRLRWGELARRALVVAALVLVVVPIAGVLVFRVVAPPPGILPIERLFQRKGYQRQWRPIGRISPNLVYAVIAAEDARFCTHRGFDGAAIEKALKNNAARPGHIRGGSTLSQQTAKNVFLWPARDYARKAAEAWYTVLIETLWGKRRILEVYLNVVEWAPGVYGAEAASQRWFHVHADQLTPQQADRLAAVLPNPLKWKAAAPGAYVRKRSGKIARNVGEVRAEDLAACVLKR
jgi:monofunctional biosynthetic peptidoglycan transglycosylase